MKKYKVTFIEANVTQELIMIPQNEYNRYLSLQKVRDSEEWKTLKKETKGITEKLLEKLDPIKILFKTGKGVTDESPLGKAILSNTDMILPETQGGVRKIRVEVL